MSESNNANSMVLSVNGLRYVMPKPLSTTLVRTFKKNYPQRQTYSPTDTIVFDLNVTGQVDSEISYLYLKVSFNAITNLSSNGILSLIRDIRISSKNGVELDRIQNFNAWSHIYLSHIIDESRLKKSDILLGVLKQYQPGTHDFIVPLSFLSGLFRPHVKGQKISSHMLSGARIELQLESVNRALISANVAASYIINKPSINLMEHVINDNTLKVLTEESANNGLEYVYDRVFTSVEQSNASIVNIQVKKAVSQATSVITSIHDPDDQQELDIDSFKSIDISINPGTFHKFQYRLGSNYFPYSVCDNISEAYMITESTYDINRDERNFTINTFPDYLTNFFAVSSALKTDHAISSSGLAVNNSSNICLEYEGDATNKIYYTFLIYTALARTFLNQVSVKV